MFNNEFYPTPKHLINKMLAYIDFRTIKTVLEPSAGKGDIAETVANKLKYYTNSYNRKEQKFDIDTIEIDENLTHILNGKGFRVIHNDFLTLQTYKNYDLIVANPPFSNGEKHLLKMIDMQQNGGKIVCILNAETLKNPYSVTRKDLKRKLEELNAKIEYMQNTFINAEKVTAVEIALIYIEIEKNNKNSIILEHLKQEEQVNNFNPRNSNNNLIDSDFIKGIIQQYNFEAKTGINLINEYENLKPYILNSFKDDRYKNPILQLTINGNEDDIRNTYIKLLRSKYWSALFTSEQFTKLLTSDLRSKYMNKISELQDYDFSYYNIKQIQFDISKVMIQSVEQTILNLFDEFSDKHSYYNEMSKNIHYYNGWKTNKSWIINKKIIIPLNGYHWGEYRPTYYNIIEKLQDIEKVFNYLDGGLTEEIDIVEELKFYEGYGETKNIQLKYFKVTFYKKGTCHITFTNDELLKKFNIFGSQKKGWLPPSYGKSKYKDMTAEEQNVINEFEGKESYNKVITNKDYYIYNPNKVLLLTETA